MFATWRRRIGLGAVAIVIVVGLWLGFRPQPVPADIVEVGNGDLVVTIDGEGVTRIKDVFVVSAPISGRLMRSTLDVGDRVRQGQTAVAAIRPTPPTFLNVRDRSTAEALVRAAEAAEGLAAAELQRVRAELTFAESDLDRAGRLPATNTVSARELDRARLEVATKAAAVASAEASLAVRREELQSARAALIEPDGGLADNDPSGECCVVISAPQDGRVLRMLLESETVVTAGTPLVEIGDPGNLELVIDLLSEDAVQVSVGDTAIIERWGGGDDLEAIVRRIEPTGFMKVSALGIEEQRVNVILDFAGPAESWTALGHDFRVYARVRTEFAEGVLTVPQSALFRVGDDWATFVVDEDARARQRKIVLGLRNSKAAEVREGLAAGDRVIVHPNDRIADGVEVVSRDALEG